MKKIFVAGHNGMVGSAICRQLQQEESIKIISCDHSELNLLNYKDVYNFIQKKRPDEVIIAAAKVGGILANDKYPADFIYENLQIQNNLIHASHSFDIQKLLFLGSSCIYPKLANQPMSENALLSGKLEPTNEPYAIAKIAGIKMCESYNRQYGRDYRSVMPTNLYGPGDNYHHENSHVVPALIRRFHEAKINDLKHVSVWGTGKPMREFLFVDDMAEASIFIHTLDQSIYKEYTKTRMSHINVGTGDDVTVNYLAHTIKEIVGYKGKIVFDINKKDGAQKKLLDVTLINNLGWKAKTELKVGLTLSYKDFLSKISS